MQKIFLSFHFNKPTDPDQHDSQLANDVQELLRSHGLLAVTGEALGGGALTPEVMKRIEESDALVALMTRRDPQPVGAGQPPAWSTHPWVDDELKHARGKGRPAIALVETGVTVAGAYQEHERVAYDRAAPLRAFLKLSTTIGLWKQQAGQTIAVQLMPADVAEALGDEGDKADCAYRLAVRGQSKGQWVPAPVFPEGGGTFIYVSGMSSETMVQVKAVLDGTVYTSKLSSQWIPIALKKGGA